jgi:drug/metabolite transporter (DMT)-like permease
VFFSVLFGFPMVTFLMMRDAQPGHLQPVHPWWTALRTLAAVVTAATAFYAFTAIPLAQVYAILFAAPLLITVLAIPILGERVGIHRGLAVLVGLGGVIVVLQPTTTSLTPGHVAAVVAAVGSALASVIMRKIGREERTVVMILYPMAANFVVMGAAMPFVYEPMPGRDLALLALISALALIATNLMIQAYRAAPAATVAPMQYSQIIWASAYGALVLRRGAGMGHASGNGDHRGLGSLHRLPRTTRRQIATTPVLRTRSRMPAPSAPRVSPFLAENRTARGVGAPTTQGAIDALALGLRRRYPARHGRSVAQPGRALSSGGRGRRFESSHSDQFSHK